MGGWHARLSNLKNHFFFNNSLHSLLKQNPFFWRYSSLASPSLQPPHCFHVSQFHTTPSFNDLVQLTIDGKLVSIERGSALIQACEKAGITIPRFCYHERLAIAGNCRMCLVELANVPKPIASCAMPVGPGMVVKTNTELVKKAREGVMEFLLANHPLDCPICDQGGECDLQDQAMVYGNDRSRFFFPKRAVEDKNFGPLVQTTMTRCIQCTRCVRFANEIAGDDSLGTTGRGNDMQIGMYIDQILQTELSGNVIDLCPVGALTNKPYSFKARPWELRKTESIDILDPIHPSIRIDARGNEVLRVLPRENPNVNEEWISDKTRFAIDGLKYQRLTTPLMKTPQGQLVPVEWETALSVIAHQVHQTPPDQLIAMAGDFADIPSMVVLKDFFCALDANQFGLSSKIAPTSIDLRSNYLLNTPLNEMEHADAIVLIATHPRLEAPLLNLRLRKAYLKGTDIAYWHHTTESKDTLDLTTLGLNYDVIPILSPFQSNWSHLKNHPFWDTLSQAKKPLILVGASVYDQPYSTLLQHSLSSLYLLLPNLYQKNKDTNEIVWHGLNFLQQGTSHVAAMDIGFHTPLTSSSSSSLSSDVITKGPSSSNQPQFIYLLNAETDQVPKDSFVVYQGHHGDVGASIADIVLPGCAYTEKSSMYMNVEGRVQSTETAVSPPGLAREDWKIVQAVAIACGVQLPYLDWPQLLLRLNEVSPTLVTSQLQPCTFQFPLTSSSTSTSSSVSSKKSSKLEEPSHQEKSLGLRIHSRSQFYLSDPISKASPTMAECARTYGSVA